MHNFILLAGMWTFAFVTLGAALVLLNIFADVVGHDFALHGLRKELILAAACSLIEAASFWVVHTYFPTATRALIVPVLAVALIYLLAHLEDWHRFDAGLVVLFQFALGAILAALWGGYYGAALLVALLLAAVLGGVAWFVKGI